MFANKAIRMLTDEGTIMELVAVFGFVTAVYPQPRPDRIFLRRRHALTPPTATTTNAVPSGSPSGPFWLHCMIAPRHGQDDAAAALLREE
jgi:hypothetical protein